MQRQENHSVRDVTSNPPEDRMTVLQSKLYQAAKAQPQRRFHALYDRLFVSYVLPAAWAQVRQNQGAAGIDQQTLEEIETRGVETFLAEIALALREKTYRPQPVRRVVIPKGDPWDRQTRPLGIPTVRDRVVQAAVKLLLEPIFEADFEGTPSFGFRPGLGPQDALTAVAQHARDGFRWVVDADIAQFFDTLDHQQLMTALRRRISDGELLRLIYRWLKAGYLLDGVYHNTDQGSPQGGVLSPLLANIYLASLEQAQATEKSFVGRLVRYADDFVLQCRTRRHAEQALAWVRTHLLGLGLQLQPTKTRLVEDREGFDFLGFHHRRVVSGRERRESRGVVRWPSRKAQQRFRERVRQLVGPPLRLRMAWNACLQDLRKYLVGWCQYYRHGHSTPVFRKLDAFLECRVARNVVRSQPVGKRRRRRSWVQAVQRLRQWGKLPRLLQLQAGAFRAYRGAAKVRWRAV
jgi:RNA-directed DNA polymerase